MDEELIPISALQHYVYCPRQFALIHIERLWMDDAATMHGQLLHRRVHEDSALQRPGIRIVNAMPIRSERYGLIGVTDRVEIRGKGQGQEIRPVEFKRGRPKAHRADEVQLCAQALCLEEMMEVTIPVGDLYYATPHRRSEVAFDAELRDLTVSVIDAVRSLLASGRTPSPVYRSRQCSRCSLIEACQPKAICAHRSAADWIRSMVESSCGDN